MENNEQRDAKIKVLKITFQALWSDYSRHCRRGALCAVGEWVAERTLADVSEFYFGDVSGLKSSSSQRVFSPLQESYRVFCFVFVKVVGRSDV